VIVWDTRTFQPLEILTGHGGRITWAAFSADSRTLFTTSLDGSILEWDLGGARRFGRPLLTHGPDLDLGPEAPSAPPLAVSPDGRDFAADTSSSTVGVFSTGDLKPRRTVHVSRGATALAWSPRGVLALGGQNG